MDQIEEISLETSHVPVNIFVSSMIFLANPNSSREELTERLRDLREKGYKTGHRIRSTPDGFYSEELEDFLGSLQMGGYVKGDFITPASFNQEGTNLLEEAVLRELVENSESVESLARELGYDFKPLTYKYVKDYLELKRERGL